MSKSAISPLPDQLPARMLNEFAYCPRLFYLEYVQREWAHNVETLEGRFVHRRVDTPGGALPDAGENTGEKKIHARSITVGSDLLGAIAVVDVVEGDGESVIPVDYKKGQPPFEGAWLSDRLQIGLQGLLLREHRYLVEFGVVYYTAANAKIMVQLDAELETLTLKMLKDAEDVARRDEPPPPLVDSPKCPRCSLVGICLPDELNLLASRTPAIPQTPQPPVPPSEPRRLVPARDDRLAVYVQGQGYSLGLKGEVLEIREKTRPVDTVRLLDVSQVNLFGNVQISAQALRELAAREIPLLHLSYGGWLAAVTTPPPHKNIDLRRKQFAAAEDPATRLALARSFTVGKIRNSRLLLRRNAQGLPDTTLGFLSALRNKAERSESIETLLGIEGNAAREYFAHFSKMFKTDAETLREFDFDGRNRRPPRDPVNALLSFVYSLLVKEMVVAAIGVGLDPYLGFYHRPRYGRPALALDLMEEFRPLIADSVVISLINTGEIRPSDFLRRGGAVALTENGRKRVLDAFERRVDQIITHPIFGYTISYRRVFEVQTRLLARFLNGEIPSYIPFVTR